MSKHELLKPEEMKTSVELCGKILEQLDRILLGRHELHEMVLAGILSRGHILLEGLPGLGKTALVRAIGEILKLDFNRVQFTPDLMPSDILGAHILQETEGGKREMKFNPGPVFTNILLADEINRASPKTQSAMLETMQEQTVTLMGTTRKLPSPFFVLASQNPIELEGTYPLPEAQLDRFMFKLHVGNISSDIMADIIADRRRGESPVPEWTASREQLEEMFGIMERIFLPKPVAHYISRIVAGTHPDESEAPSQVTEYVSYGASPRAAIAIAEAARATALISNRPTAGFGDVRRVAAAVLNHRIILNYKAKLDHITTHDVVEAVLSETDDTGISLPDDVSVEGSAA